MAYRSFLRNLMMAAVAAGVASPASGQSSAPARAGEDSQRRAVIVQRFSERLLEQLGADRDGLPLDRWPNATRPIHWDRNGDGKLTADELAAAINEYARHKSLRALAAPTLPAAPSPATAPAPPGPEVPAPPQPASPPSESPGTADAAPGSDASENAGKTRVSTEASGGGPNARRFHVARSRLAAGVPPWMSERDTDGDGQLTLAEFAPEPNGQLVEAFRRLDLNGDGVVTPAEARRSVSEASAASSTESNRTERSPRRGRQTNTQRRGANRSAPRPTTES